MFICLTSLSFYQKSSELEQSGIMEPIANPAPSIRGCDTGNDTVYKSTRDAYDEWAAVYDSDGNFLQALDSEMMAQMLPTFMDSFPENGRVVDLGCGTGRNTLELLRYPRVDVLGLDFSSGMLALARSRCETLWDELPKESRATMLEFETWDMLSLADSDGKIPVSAKDVDAIVSTLVIEHIPLPIFFKACSQMLKPGGKLLLTNMHHDMGAISQAGFVDPATGKTVRPTSYIHTVRDVVTEARSWGLNFIGEVQEVGVSEGDVERLGKRSRKWIGVRIWFGMVLKKAVSESQ